MACLILVLQWHHAHPLFGMQDYKKIKAWAKGHALKLNIHQLLRRFPREYSSLKGQLRRAAESVPTNIVEGAAFDSNKQFAVYVQSSISSANEVEYHLITARDYGLISQRVYSALVSDTIEVRKMLIGFKKRLQEPEDEDEQDENVDDAPKPEELNE